jgi:hypothetical protein
MMMVGPRQWVGEIIKNLVTYKNHKLLIITLDLSLKKLLIEKEKNSQIKLLQKKHGKRKSINYKIWLLIKQLMLFKLAGKTGKKLQK